MNVKQHEILSRVTKNKSGGWSVKLVVILGGEIDRNPYFYIDVDTEDDAKMLRLELCSILSRYASARVGGWTSDHKKA